MTANPNEFSVKIAISEKSKDFNLVVINFEWDPISKTTLLKI